MLMHTGWDSQSQLQVFDEKLHHITLVRLFMPDIASHNFYPLQV